MIFTDFISSVVVSFQYLGEDYSVLFVLLFCLNFSL